MKSSGNLGKIIKIQGCFALLDIRTCYYINEYRENIGCCQRWEVIESGEVGQKVQTISYKLNRSWGCTTCTVIHSMVTIANNTVLYI